MLSRLLRWRHKAMKNAILSKCANFYEEVYLWNPRLCWTTEIVLLKFLFAVVVEDKEWKASNV